MRGWMLLARLGAAAIAGALPAGPAAAQPCAVRTVPAEDIAASSSGWLSFLGLVGSAVDRARRAGGNARASDAAREWIGPEAQLRRLAGYDLARMLGAPACGTELRVERIRITRAAGQGPRLVASFTVAAQGAPPRRGRGEAAIDAAAPAAAPAAEPEAQEEARAALTLAFGRAFENFAAGHRLATLPWLRDRPR
jgi:hypothetical protein